MTLPLSTTQRRLLSLQVQTLPAYLSTQDYAELRDLSALARRVRASTPPLGRNRRASERLDALLLHHRTRGVAIPALATATSLTERSIRNRLPELAQLPPLRALDSNGPLPEFLIVWPGTASARRWWTYVDQKSHLPARLVYSNPLTSQAHPLPLPYARLSPDRAREELGWLHTDPTARLIPNPAPPTHGGEPVPVPQEELSA